MNDMPVYTLADMRRQQADWLTAAISHTVGDEASVRAIFLTDRPAVTLDEWCELVALATLGAMLCGNLWADSVPAVPPGVGLQFTVRPNDPRHEPAAVTMVAARMVENAANGHNFEVAAQANAWASFDELGMRRMQELLRELLDIYCWLVAA